MIHDALRRQVRLKAGRKPEPSAAIVNSQTVKNDGKRGARGYDSGKLTKGRKRHIPVVHAAIIHDRDGAKLLLNKIKDKCQRLKLIWADGAYAGRLIDWVKTFCGWLLEVVRKRENSNGLLVWPGVGSRNGRFVGLAATVGIAKITNI